jgi:molybdenum cofactor biosynthesis protein B
MSSQGQKKVRVLTGCVSERRSRAVEELGRLLGDELKKAGFEVMRHVVVKGEAQHVQALVSNVSTGNEADAIVLVGGTGFGPRDHVCEALDAVYERHIEGFGEAYRRLLRSDIGVHAALARATAGTFDQCVVFALNGRPEDVRLAIEVLVAPILAEAVELAQGRPRGEHTG